MIRTSRVATALIALGAALWLAAPVGAQPVMYKYLDANGKVIYSDQAPPPGVKFEKIQPNTKATGVDKLGVGAAEADAMARDRRAREAAQNQAVTDAQQSYDSAVAVLEAAREPREGERIHNANGTSRLTDEYRARIAPLEQKVEELRLKLDQARRN